MGKILQTKGLGKAKEERRGRGGCAEGAEGRLKAVGSLDFLSSLSIAGRIGWVRNFVFDWMLFGMMRMRFLREGDPLDKVFHREANAPEWRGSGGSRTLFASGNARPRAFAWR